MEFYDRNTLIIEYASGIVRIDFRHICALHAHRARPLRFLFLYRVDNRIRAYSTKTAPFRASAEVLAKWHLKAIVISDTKAYTKFSDCSPSAGQFRWTQS